ncbi:MAG: XRE family transcriptional regulator [Alphaproteobacteria bacterium]|nr:XRE family transcriptional regulator [Alphaproteobacteria bacterium]
MKTSPKTIHNPRYNRLVAELVKMRKAKKLTQRDLAEKFQTSHCFIARTEIKERRLDLIETIDLMKTLGFSKSEILKIIEKLI